MKKILFLGLAFFANLSCYGQNNDTWYSFYNKDSELVGFKDKAGVIKIEPKFVGRSNRPIKLENIISVIEENNGNVSGTAKQLYTSPDISFYPKFISLVANAA